jgi:hypothetical protein
MNFFQKPFLLLKKEINAGGIVHVPPTGCLLSTYASACVTAHVERTGATVTKKLNDMGTVQPVTFNNSIWVLELMS